MPIKEEVRTVTANGRMIVPWSIQRALGLEHGGSVRFRVEDGVVTLEAANAPATHTAEPRGSDIRGALTAELRMLMVSAERDRAKEPATQ